MKNGVIGCTLFFKSPQVEFFRVSEEYEEKGERAREKTHLHYEYDDLYSRVMGEKIDHSRYLPKYVRVPDSEVKRILQSEDEHRYNLLDDFPHLYTEIIKIDMFDKDSLEKFIYSFGLPMGADKYGSDDHTIFHYDLELTDFYKELNAFKVAFDIFEALQENNEETINYYADDYFPYIEHKSNAINLNTVDSSDIAKQLKDMERGDSKIEKHWSLMNEEASKNKKTVPILERYMKVKDESPRIKSTQYMLELINSWDKGKSIIVTDSDTIQNGITFTSLMEVAKYQLAQSVVNNYELRRCEFCGRSFPVDHDKRRFCPPVYPATATYKISNCQNTFNQRAKRKRKKDKAQALDMYKIGHSAQHIAQETGREIEEIEKWINT